MPPVLDTTIDHLPGSGSGVVDWNNSSGLRNGLEKTLLIFYTDYKKGSCILYSNDRGRSWVRYKGNPVLPGFDDTRDPNVFWYSAGQEWRMVRYEKKGFVFYGSRDLLHWRWLSRIEGFYECPDLFELPVQNLFAEYRWILVDGDGSYVVGQFDGTRFVADSPKLRAEYGTALYATQTWKNSGSSSGPMQIAWLKYPKQSMLTWDGQMSFPVELSLRRLPEGIRLIRQPIGAIQELWSSQRTWSGLEVTSEEQQLPGLESQLLDLTLVMESKGATEFGLKIHGQEIRYSTKQQMLYVDSASAPLALEGGQLHLRILVDRSSLEVFTYPGAVSISTVTLTHADEPITLISRGGSATIVSLLANSLESIWPPQRSNPQSKLWP
jgi:sucrose-6-phosphate hydrolase SacC (GH32 family)